VKVSVADRAPFNRWTMVAQPAHGRGQAVESTALDARSELIEVAVQRQRGA